MVMCTCEIPEECAHMCMNIKKEGFGDNTNTCLLIYNIEGFLQLFEVPVCQGHGSAFTKNHVRIYSVKRNA